MFTEADPHTVGVLIVDDDDIDVMALHRSFKKLGLTNPLYRARDGLEAIQLLQAKSIPSPYIIILDINMPRMNGLEFLAAARADPELTQAPIIVFSTGGLPDDLLLTLGDTIAGHMVKPVSNSSYLATATLLAPYLKAAKQNFSDH